MNVFLTLSNFICECSVSSNYALVSWTVIFDSCHSPRQYETNPCNIVYNAIDRN